MIASTETTDHFPTLPPTKVNSLGFTAIPPFSATKLVIHVTGADARLQPPARESPALASYHHGAGALFFIHP
jgi:hypothetical protein